MTASNPNAAPAMIADISETAAHCLRAGAELQARLATGWLEMFTLGILQRGAAASPPSMAHWTLDAMRLTAETTLRNIERCQECARRAGGQG